MAQPYWPKSNKTRYRKLCDIMFLQLHAQCFLSYYTISRGVWPHRGHCLPVHPFLCDLAWALPG